MANGSGNGDWTIAVERSVAADWQRRLTWTRWALGVAATVGAIALALLAWQLASVPAQTRAIAREVAAEIGTDVATAAAERVSTRHVAPLRQTDAEVYANQVALARHQVDLESRLRALEVEAARLQRLLGVPAAPPPGR